LLAQELATCYSISNALPAHSERQMRTLLALLVLAALTACGGSADPFEANGDGSKATIDPPNCAASGACK